MMTTETKKGNITTWLVALVAIVAVVGLVWYATSSGTESPPESNPAYQEDDTNNDAEYVDEEITIAPDTGVTTDTILEDPTSYIGQQVTVQAEVEERLSARAFTLDAPGIVDDSLLVITEEPNDQYEDPEWFGDNIWEVQGTVRRFVYDDVTAEMTLDIPAEDMESYEGMPYISANSVELFEE